MGALMKFISLFAVAITLSLVCVGQSRAMTEYEAALQVTGYADSIPMMSSYCHKKFRMPDVERAGVEWTERHEEVLKEARTIIHGSGGIPSAQENLLSGILKDQITSTIDNDSDPKGFCKRLGDRLDSGGMDLDQSSDFLPALKALAQQ